MVSNSMENCLKTLPDNSRTKGGQTPDNGRTKAGQMRRNYSRESDLSPWLRDGVSAFLTLWTPHCPWCHIAPGCKTMPLAEPLP